ncbi:MAG: serine hydroxymethyltransferase, partial [Planctomycetes bacterium]|nr:serine hydroxymethyltransferase [Planctomycetota bacterium]
LAASGSIMTNKYAEGYPGARYYAGCEYVDVAETLAIQRAKQIFGAEHANVQPHSGTQANMAVLFAMLKPGDTVLSMNLAHGGHLSHGAKKSFCGRFYNIVTYGVSPETEMLDMNTIRRIARECKPQMIIAGASAYPRLLDYESFADIAKEVGAYLLVDIAHVAGLVAADLHPNPVHCSDFVTATTHKTMRGPRGGIILCKKKYAAKIDSEIFPGIQGGPLMHTVAGKAVALREALADSFKDYQKQILANCQTLLNGLKCHGYRIVAGGSDNHLFLVDLRNRNITGKTAYTILHEAGITLNHNLIPFDPKPPKVTSGVRIGTPAVTTRGMKEPEMQVIAEWIDAVLSNPEDRALRTRVRGEVRDLCERFPLYEDLHCE